MKKRKILDIILFILLLFLMIHSKTSQTIHEILGIIIITCFIVHHIWNIKWYKTIFNKKTSTIKNISIIINILLSISCFIVIISGISMSRLISYFNIMPMFLARRLHLIFSYWAFILMAIHLGLHFKSILIFIQRKFNKINTRLLSYISYLFILLGVILFIKNQMISYLFALSDFVFVNENTSLIQYIIEYFIIFMLFVIVTYYLVENLKDTK